MKQATNQIFKANVISRIYAESALRMLGVNHPEVMYTGFDVWKYNFVFPEDHRVKYRHHFSISFFQSLEVWVDITVVKDSKSMWGYAVDNADCVRVIVPLPNPGDSYISKFLRDPMLDESFGLTHQDPKIIWTTPVEYKNSL